MLKKYFIVSSVSKQMKIKGHHNTVTMNVVVVKIMCDDVVHCGDWVTDGIRQLHRDVDVKYLKFILTSFWSSHGILWRSHLVMVYGAFVIAWLLGEADSMKQGHVLIYWLKL